MAFKGSLGGVDFIEVLEWLSTASKTGALRLVNRDLRKVIYFDKGAIVALESNEPSDSSRCRLAGILSEDQLASALYVVERTGRDLLSVLKQTGAVDDRGLDAIAAETAREAIWGVFVWAQGTFAFEEGVEPPPSIWPIAVGVIEVHGEGLRRRQLADQIRAHYPVEASVFCRTGEGEAGTERVLAARLFELLAEPQTVFSLGMLAPASELAVVAEVARMLDRGLVTVVAEAETGTLGARLEALSAMLNGRTAAAPVRPVSVAILDRATGRSDGSRRGADGEVARSPVKGNAKELLAQARALVEARRFEEALELFVAAEQADPRDSRLGELRRGAESVLCDVLYRSELDPSAFPVRRAGVVRDAAPLELRLLDRLDGETTVRHLVVLAEEAEVDVLRTLCHLKRRGLVELRA